MKNSSKFLKIVFTVLVFSLVVPLSPSVSSAKARICCKKVCKSMMGTAPQATSKTTNQGKSATGVAPCGNESCLITDKKSESVSFVVAQSTTPVDFTRVALLEKESSQVFQSVPVQGTANKHRKSPLYLFHSIFRI